MLSDLLALLAVIGGVSLAATVLAFLTEHPSPWRCDACAARFPTADQLDLHEARHEADKAAARLRHPAYLPAMPERNAR